MMTTAKKLAIVDKILAIFGQEIDFHVYERQNAYFSTTEGMSRVFAIFGKKLVFRMLWNILDILNFNQYVWLNVSEPS